MLLLLSYFQEKLQLLDATQSSKYVQEYEYDSSHQSLNTDHTADKAIDGQTSDGQMWLAKYQRWGQCSSTNGYGGEQWWRANLQRAAVISMVRIYPREDCCKDR